MTDSFETFRWEQLAKRQKVYIVAAIVAVIVVMAFGFYGWWKSYSEVRQFEQAAITAKREAEEALKNAAEIARQKVKLEKRVEETEAKVDVKRKEQHEAQAQSAGARLEYERSLREQRGDNPSIPQLCAELAALGHPC